MAHSARALPPMELQNVSLKASLRKKDSQPEESSVKSAETLAAVLFDAAMTEAGLSNKVAAADADVSESMVSRWRKAEYREQPSYAQLLKLPAEFHEARQRVESRYFGHGRKALMQLLEAAGELAAVG